MSEAVPSQFDGVSVVCKASIYFDGKVVSHTILFPDGSRKTLGLLYGGAYTFTTGAAERMDIIAGSCRVQVAGESASTAYEAGMYFEVPAQSSFDIEVPPGITEYVCTYK